ncbi:hypothetical protein TNCT_287871 [Trichonephila clavata]|uniref:Uncharacterized protein n=1 Tax=Trichonephila clavata TaxID=2740835 RepID=A0A8X6LER6_TRICU|nr:hypothetical protein TNCT_287871 [Trichonephila clavata]
MQCLRTEGIKSDLLAAPSATYTNHDAPNSPVKAEVPKENRRIYGLRRYNMIKGWWLKDPYRMKKINKRQISVPFN